LDISREESMMILKIIMIEKKVVNLLDETLDLASQSILEYGLNSSIVPNSIVVEELICNIETIAKDLLVGRNV
jgi:hypothetical protein